MPTDTKDHIAGLYTLLAKFPLEEYLSSENFAVFCREQELVDTWKEHLDTSRDRPDLYGNDSTKNAFILFFHHLFQTRSSEFPGILTGFLRDFRTWNASPLTWAAIKEECTGLGFPLPPIEDEFLKSRNRL
jgi:hypothetical protein